MCGASHRRIPTPACSVMKPSGCAVAAYLAKLYHTHARSSGRGGANIPRRIEIASRIAACRIHLSHPAHLPSGWLDVAAEIIVLTRANLRDMGVCSSEAADLCMFFKAVQSWFPCMMVAVCLDAVQQLVLQQPSSRSGLHVHVGPVGIISAEDALTCNFALPCAH